MFGTIETRTEHMKYESMNVEFRIAVDFAFKAAVKELKANNVDCAMDDRAEELIAAIAYYVRRSEDL